MDMSASTQQTYFGRVFAPDREWLARQPPEDVLVPELSIVDPHQHFWRRPNTSYFLDDFVADLRTGHNVVATVFVECSTMFRARGAEAMRPVGEVEFANGIAAMSASGLYGPARIAEGIVGHADMTLGDRLQPVLEALVRAGGGRLRGVRHSGGWDDDPAINNSRAATGPLMMREPAFRAGVQRLGGLELNFDSWVFHPQLDEVTELARACPGTSITLCHVGGVLGYGSYAGRKDEVFATWKKKITGLATCPNVTVKLGGMMNRLAAYDYRSLPAPASSVEMASHWRPFMETCIELFGPGRCMFESNFPVDKMGTNWVPLWNAFKRIAAGASADEKEALFNRTARRVYRLTEA